MLTRRKSKAAKESPFGGSDSSSDDEQEHSFLSEIETQKDDLAQSSEDEEDDVDDDESVEMVPDQLPLGYTGNAASTLLKTPQKKSDVKVSIVRKSTKNSSSKDIEKEESNEQETESESENVEVEPRYAFDGKTEIERMSAILDEGHKKGKIREYESIINNIKTLLAIIAVDQVYQKKVEKKLEKYRLVAVEYDQLIKNQESLRGLYWYQQLVPKLTGTVLPERIQAEHKKMYVAKPEQSFLDKISKEKASLIKSEDLGKACYGEKLWNLAATAKTTIFKSMNKKWREPTSGQTDQSVFYGIRYALWKVHEAEQAKERERKNTNYQSKSSEGEDKKKRSYNRKTKDFNVKWFPKEWLAFMLLAEPARENRLPYLKPDAVIDLSSDLEQDNDDDSEEEVAKGGNKSVYVKQELSDDGPSISRADKKSEKVSGKKREQVVIHEHKVSIDKPKKPKREELCEVTGMIMELTNKITEYYEKLEDPKLSERQVKHYEESIEFYLKQRELLKKYTD